MSVYLSVCLSGRLCVGVLGAGVLACFCTVANLQGICTSHAMAHAVDVCLLSKAIQLAVMRLRGRGGGPSQAFPLKAHTIHFCLSARWMTNRRQAVRK